MSSSTAPSSLPHWQLESIYPSLDSLEFAADKRKLADAIDGLAALLDQRCVRAGANAPTDDGGSAAHVATLEAAIQHLDGCASLLATIQPFVNLRVATDAFDERSQAEVSALRPLTSQYIALVARFKAWVGGLDLDALSARSTIVADHRYQLER
ncbi:MAG TPA: hypothetical protein VFN03_13605, partial [Trueperaceae bacterium]|nr:hypothetical protein [Trueperaceae bacterium]